MLSKTYLLFKDKQIHVLRSREAEIWKSGRRKLLKDNEKGCRIDGIMDSRRYIHTWTYNLKFYDPARADN